MQDFFPGNRPNPHDLSIHKQVKDIADMLRPELLRLYKKPDEFTPNDDLYAAFCEQIRSVRKEVTSCDALFTFHNILDHMGKIKDLSEEPAKNRDILHHLQDVMAFLFKLQNLPS